MKKILLLLFCFLVSSNFVNANKNIISNSDLFIESLYNFKNSHLKEINNYIDEKGGFLMCDYIDVELDSSHNYKTVNSLIVGNKDLLCKDKISVKDFTKKTLLSQISLGEKIVTKYKDFQDEKFRLYNKVSNNGRVKYDFSIIGDYKQSNIDNFSVEGNFRGKIDPDIKNIYKNLNICYLSKSTKKGLIECLELFMNTVKEEKSGFLDAYKIKYTDFKNKDNFYNIKLKIDRIDFSKFSYEKLILIMKALDKEIKKNNSNKNVYIYLRDKVQKYYNNL